MRVCLSGSIPEFLSWRLSGFALQRLQIPSEDAQTPVYAAAEYEIGGCTRAEPPKQHRGKTGIRQCICAWIKEIPDRRPRRRVRETPDKSKSTRCSSNRLRSVRRALAHCQKQAIYSVRRNRRSAFGP